MRLLLLALPLLTYGPPPAASAENELCAPVDLRAKFGPVRNQAETGWCYAFSAADALAFTIGLKPSSQLSAFHVGARYATASLPKLKKAVARVTFSNGRDPERAIEFHESRRGKPMVDRMGGSSSLTGPITMAAGSKLCLESAWPSETRGGDRRSSRLLGLEWSTIGQRIMNREQDLLEELVPPPSMVDCPVLQPAAPADLRSVAAVRDWIAQKLVRDRAAKCAMPVSIPNNLRTRETDFSQHRRAGLRKIDQLISREKPVIIGYDVCHFLKEGEGGCGHASLVIGRRFNQAADRCEYLVRNSWGTSCDGYATGIECEEGNFWAPAEGLARAVDRVGWVE